MGRSQTFGRMSAMCRKQTFAVSGTGVAELCERTLRATLQKMENGWDNSAEAWLIAMSERGDWGRVAVLDPIMLHRARRLSPARALDVGCGEGRFCRLLADEGVRTTGMILPQLSLRLHSGATRAAGICWEPPRACRFLTGHSILW
jgi:hypothetical protein